jgi:hypothetical protein
MKVPVIQSPSVRSAPTPGFRERLGPAPAGQTGTAVKAIGQMASSTWNMLEQEKAKADAARAVQEIAEFTREADRVMFDPTVDEATGRPVGYKLQQGEDAFGARDAYTKRIEDLVEQHAGRLANDDQKAAFRHHATAKVTSYLKEIQAHAGNEAERAQSQAYKIDREVELNHIASFADNPEIRASSIANLRKIALAEGSQRGLKASDQAEWADLAEADANAAALNSLLSKGKVDEAEAFYATVKGKLGAQGDRIARYLAEAKAQVAVEVKSSEIVKAAMLPGYSWINQGKAMAAVEAMEPSAEKDRVRTLVEHRVAKLEQLRKDTANKKYNQALAIYDLTGTLESQAMVELRNWFQDPNNAATEHWIRIKRNIAAEKRAGRTSDAQERREQRERNLLAMEEFQSLEPGERVRLDIDARFRGFADQTTLFRLKRIQNASKRVVEGGGLARESEFRQFAQQAAKDVGLTKETMADFQTYIDGWRVQYLEDHDGKEPTRKEMQQAVADALLYGDEKGGGWFSPNRYKFQAERKGEPFTPFSAEEQKYKPSSALGTPTTPAPAPPARGRSLDVPADERAQIIEALKATGKPVSEDAIKDRYARMLSRRGG